MRGMVHALQAVGGVLRPGGVLVSIQPERFEARIAIRDRSDRISVGRLINPAFDRYQVAAERALLRVGQLGSLTLAGAHRHRYRIRLDSPAQLREYIELLGTPRPRASAGTWSTLRRLWAFRPPGARVEVTDGMLITALQKAGR